MSSMIPPFGFPGQSAQPAPVSPVTLLTPMLEQANHLLPYITRLQAAMLHQVMTMQEVGQVFQGQAGQEGDIRMLCQMQCVAGQAGGYVLTNLGRAVLMCTLTAGMGHV